MPDLTDYMNALTLGTNVSDITGKAADGFVAGGFGAFVKALTGELPTVVTLPNKKASIVLTADQAKTIRSWLDGQLMGFLKPKDASLDIQMNPVIVPWILKFLVPAALLLIAAGWAGHYYFSR